MTTPFGRSDGFRTGAAPLTAAVSTVGVMIRYSFYVVGLLVLGLIGLTILKVSSYMTVKVEGLAVLPDRRLVARSAAR